MANKQELDSFGALKMLIEFFKKNDIDTETMAYMIECFMFHIEDDDTPRMALAEAKNMFNPDTVEPGHPLAGAPQP